MGFQRSAQKGITILGGINYKLTLHYFYFHFFTLLLVIDQTLFLRTSLLFMIWMLNGSDGHVMIVSLYIKEMNKFYLIDMDKKY